MKIVFANMFVVFVLPIVLFAEKVQEKSRIGIMKFEVSQSLDPSLSDFLYNNLLDQMVLSGNFTVVDWEEINRVHQYIAQSQPNVSEKEARKQAINQLGLQQMYLGSLHKVESRYYISVKVLNLDLSVVRIVKDSVDSLDSLVESIEYIALQLTAEPEEAKRLQQERQLWQKAQRDKSEESLNIFLNNFPKSIYADEARQEYERLQSTRLAEEQKKKEEQGKEKQQQQLHLQNNIAGEWSIECEKLNTLGNKYYLIANKSTVEIHQDGNLVSFEGWVYSKEKKLIFSGTFDSGKLIVNAQEQRRPYSLFTIEGSLDENLTLISGTICWTLKPSEFHAKITLTRLDLNTDPMKYINVHPIQQYRKHNIFCFIATAAYGSPWEKNVVTLRDFRDRWLLTNGPGCWFVETYYRLSPPLANAIAERSWARWVTRVLLTPLVVVAGAMMGKPVDICIAITFVVASVILVRAWRKRIRKKVKAVYANKQHDPQVPKGVIK